MKRQLLVFLVGAAAFTLSCSSDEPCFPDTKGKEYRVTIVQFLGSTPQCPVDFDLFPGASFLVKVDRFRGSEAGGCMYGMGAITEGPDGWAWTDASSAYNTSTQGQFFQGLARAEAGGCIGSVVIAIDATVVPTNQSSSGKTPLATVYRVYSDNPPRKGCVLTSGVCTDRFAAEIEEI